MGRYIKVIGCDIASVQIGTEYPNLTQVLNRFKHSNTKALSTVQTSTK